jgi:hypothetical protein
VQESKVSLLSKSTEYLRKLHTQELPTLVGYCVGIHSKVKEAVRDTLRFRTTKESEFDMNFFP